MHSTFETLIETQKIPPVLLLVGSRQTANLLNAKELAKKILGPKHFHKIEHDLHPDLHIYEIEGKNAMHSMASMQQLLKEIALTPFEADFKIFIIDQAERMLPSSSNALLKTLEEPPADSYLILITSNPDELLPTIVSRSRKISFENLSQASMSQFEENVQRMIEHASKKNYDQLLEEIVHLEKTHFAEDAGSVKWREQSILLFETIVCQIRSYSSKSLLPENLPPFKQIADLVESCYLGLERHIKLRSVLLHFFMKIF